MHVDKDTIISINQNIFGIINHLRNKNLSKLEIIEILGSRHKTAIYLNHLEEIDYTFDQNLRTHFKNKFMIASLKSPELSDYRKKLLKIINNEISIYDEYRENKVSKTLFNFSYSYHPYSLVTTACYFYDEDKFMQSLTKKYNTFNGNLNDVDKNYLGKFQLLDFVARKTKERIFLENEKSNFVFTIDTDNSNQFNKWFKKCLKTPKSLSFDNLSIGYCKGYKFKVLKIEGDIEIND